MLPINFGAEKWDSELKKNGNIPQNEVEQWFKCQDGGFQKWEPWVPEKGKIKVDRNKCW